VQGEHADDITAADAETLAFSRVQSFVESSLLFRRRPWLPDPLLDEQIALANRRFPFCFAALRPEADIDFRVTYREPVGASPLGATSAVADLDTGGD
jgi:hypothetical protein